MSAFGSYLRKAAPGRILHWCPGCDEAHQIAVEQAQENGARWSFNDDPASPTFTPSVKISSGHYARQAGPGDCWCDFEARTGERPDFVCSVCHYLITAGQIIFCADSTHALAGKTVPLPPWPEPAAPV